MRITGGVWRSRRLPTSGLRKVRPATDQQRESVFNMLSNVLSWRVTAVLDLFAGSGSFGLEALSRGAFFAVFVERHRGNAKVLRDTLRAFDAEKRSKVINMNVRKFVRLPREQFVGTTGFGLVFYDPPYDQDYTDILEELPATGYVTLGSIVVVKRSIHTPLPRPAYYREYGIRRFGDTIIELWIVDKESPS